MRCDTRAAILCFLVGLATLWVPIPTGLLLIALGFALLLMSSPHVAAWLRWLRRRNAELDRRLLSLEPYLPGQLRRALASTRAPLSSNSPVR